MKKNKTASYRAIIAAFSSEQRQLLRARAMDPFDSSPFKTTGKRGEKYIYIAYRPDRVTKVNLGDPAQILEILDEFETTVVLPPPPVGTPEPPPIKSPPQPPLPPTPDTSWRLPLGLSAVAALASLLISLPSQLAEQPAANTRPNVSTGAANVGVPQVDMPQPSTRSAAPMSTFRGVTRIDAPTAVAAPRADAQQNASAPPVTANEVNRLEPSCGKLANVFAALTAACKPVQSVQTGANPSSVKTTTENLAVVATILASEPSGFPVLPRASNEDRGLRWPDSALVQNVEHNLGAVSYEGGVLVLWVADSARLAESVATRGGVITAISGWENGPWSYTIHADRIEIREAAR